MEPFEIDGVYGGRYDIDSPEVEGYIPDIECVDIVLEEDTDIIVTYSPSPNTKYTVEHYLQNLEDDDYTLYETEELSGLSKPIALPPRRSIAVWKDI